MITHQGRNQLFQVVDELRSQSFLRLWIHFHYWAYSYDAVLLRFLRHFGFSILEESAPAACDETTRGRVALQCVSFFTEEKGSIILLVTRLASCLRMGDSLQYETMNPPPPLKSIHFTTQEHWMQITSDIISRSPFSSTCKSEYRINCSTRGNDYGLMEITLLPLPKYLFRCLASKMFNSISASYESKLFGSNFI
ncbi:hypothetical protein SADUNF_Sadunf16G0152400 [Salix dunnii]|uniref:Uncharacterized protein n=1 Tax=Salix dunnii TaxID=1413687 RepID=A0A835JC99_9ROSI|nr:hypothetical protein SADUNF_Sadunf16G0152400 [Salix dunnii]